MTRKLTCAQAHNMLGAAKAAPTPDLLPKITQAVREADIHFERVGGGSRHWVRDCFLPMLEKHGLVIVSREETDANP